MSGCPTCGCRVYAEHGRCHAERFVQAVEDVYLNAKYPEDITHGVMQELKQYREAIKS